MSDGNKEVNISAFLDEEGKIKQWPAASKNKIAVVGYLAGKCKCQYKNVRKVENNYVQKVS